MNYLRGIDALGVCRDDHARVLITLGEDGRWSLPGGSIEHGEHPAEALGRAAGAQLGPIVTVGPGVGVVTDIDEGPRERRHRDQIVFSIAIDGSPDPARWVDAAGVETLPVTTAVRWALGLPAQQTENHHSKPVPWSAIPGVSDVKRQRFAAYGLATDRSGGVLLTLIADGYPGAGRWHLPGGGTDFGETAEAGLLREVVEETGQEAEVGALRSVSHRHQHAARGPERVSMDWHGVRVVFALRVPHPTTAVVIDGGGSTAAAAWFPLERARQLPLSEVAADALATKGA